MPIIKSSETPTFELEGLHVTGLAAPSRGSSESCTWRLRLAPGAPGQEHAVDREEIFVVLSGSAVATLDGSRIELAAGDTLIVPPHTAFSLANPGDVACEAIAVFPVGGCALVGGSERFVPPWAV